MGASCAEMMYVSCALEHILHNTEECASTPRHALPGQCSRHPGTALRPVFLIMKALGKMGNEGCLSGQFQKEQPEDKILS